MPAVTAETLAALATIGLEAGYNLTHRKIHASLDPRLIPVEGKVLVYSSSEPSLAEAFPSGLTLMEAIGYSAVLRWAADDGPNLPRAPLRWLITQYNGAWFARLPGRELQRELPPEEALELAQALLHIRRIVWPAQPWRLRDWVAEHIERQVRQIEASLRPPQRPEVITPYTAASDVGRAWS